MILATLWLIISKKSTKTLYSNSDICEMKMTLSRCLVLRKFGHIGDLLMMTPALKELSKKNIVDLLIPKKYAEVFKNLSFINKIYFSVDEVRKNKIKYDAIYNLSDYEFNYEQIYQNNIVKTKQVLFADSLNVKIKSVKPIIELAEKEKKFIEKYFEDNNITKKTIVLAPKSANVSRDWPLENWKELIIKIKKLNYQIIILDNNLFWDDDELIFFNNHTVREVFSLIYKSDFVISHDSGPLHFAGAFDKPCLGIFGPTNPKMRAIYVNSYYINEKLDCSPCWYNRCENVTCMKKLKVDKVENKFLEVIQNV